MFEKFILIASIVLAIVGRILRENLRLAFELVVLITVLKLVFFGFSWWGFVVGLVVALLTVLGGAILLALSVLNSGGNGK